MRSFLGDWRGFSIQAFMNIAIFSDVHSNLPALEAVLKDMEAQGVDSKVCLGDVVGYNAEPAACLKKVREVCDCVIQGNHDQASATDMDLMDFNPLARAGIEYSRDHLSEPDRRYLRELPLVRVADGWTCVHASLYEPAEWVYVTSPLEAALHFHEQTTPIAFCGHTHRPMIWFVDDAGEIGIAKSREIIRLNKPRKYLVNVGSVGQVRDGDPRACYAIFDPETKAVRFRRVDYSVEDAQKKILAAALPPFLALRLQVGI
jgi:predicted phosphodiesterase